MRKGEYCEKKGRKKKEGAKKKGRIKPLGRKKATRKGRKKEICLLNKNENCLQDLKVGEKKKRERKGGGRGKSV